MNTYISKRLKKALRLGVISFLFPLSSSLFTSCEDVPMPFNNPELPPEPDVVVIDPSGDGTKENPYNVAGVLAYINTLGADVESDKDIYVTGVITSVTESFSKQYGNASFVISDTDEGTNKFTFYRGLYLGNKKYSNESDTNIKEDDVVIICGKVINFKGSTPETVQNKAYVVSINGKGSDIQPSEGGTPKGSGTLADPYNATAANAYIATLAADTESDKDIYIKGKIIDIEDKNQFNTNYGNCTFHISDDGTDNGDKFYVFRTYYLGNQKYSDDSWTKPKKGDDVIICGKVVNYKGNTPETVANKNYIYSLNGKSDAPGGGGGSSTADVGSIDKPKTCTEALAVINALEDGKTTDDAYYVKGKITKIVTAEDKIAQYKNIDYWISDGTSEIEVFRGKNLDNTDFTGPGQINVGDEVIVLGKLQKFVKDGNMTPEMAQGNYIVKYTKGSGGGDTPSTDVKKVTVAQFNAAAESKDVWYQITGTVKNLKDGDQYGNFDLEDETGSVYVYGLLSEKGGEKKKFQDLVAAKGIKNGSKITIIANRSSYKDQIQAANAYFVSIEAGGGDSAGDGSKVVSVADFLAAATSTDVWYKLTGTVKNLKDGDQYGNFDLEDSTGSVYVYGLLAEKGGEKKKFQDLVTAKGIKNGSKITIIGNRAEYKGTAQVGNAYFVSIE